MSNNNTKMVELFRAGEPIETSEPFIIDSQVTIRGIGMMEGDQVTFRLLKIKPGAPGFSCDCINVPPVPADIESVQPLYCNACEGTTRALVRLTPENPVIILDYPQGAYIQAVYEGDGLGTATVFANFGTTTKYLTQGMRGCPDECAEPNWQETGNRRCNVETGKYECQEADGLGNTRWSECGDLVWADTGTTQVLPDGTVQKQQVDQCGDIKWVTIPENEIVWTPTANVKCVIDEDDTSDDYLVEREYANQYGQRKWEVESTRPWMNTDYSVCIDHKVNVQQITICGDTRWKVTKEACGYLATFPLPGGGLAFRPGMEDPAATVEMQDCDGNVIAYLYPEARENASLEVSVNCANGGTLIGYAVNGGEAAGCSCSTCGTGSKDGFNGFLTHVPPLAIGSMPAMHIANMPSSLDIHIRSVPRQAVGTFELCGRMQILFNDGTYEPILVDCGEDTPVVETVTLNYINKFPAVANGVEMGTRIVERNLAMVLPEWEGPVVDGAKFAGWSLSPDSRSVDFPAGTRIVPKFGMAFYAVWTFTMDYVSDEEAANMPNGQSYNPAVGYKLYDNIPKRENWAFAGWIDTNNGNAPYAEGAFISYAKDQWETLLPSIMKAVWQELR